MLSNNDLKDIQDWLDSCKCYHHPVLKAVEDEMKRRGVRTHKEDKALADLLTPSRTWNRGPPLQDLDDLIPEGEEW